MRPFFLCTLILLLVGTALAEQPQQSSTLTIPPLLIVPAQAPDQGSKPGKTVPSPAIQPPAAQDKSAPLVAPPAAASKAEPAAVSASQARKSTPSAQRNRTTPTKKFGRGNNVPPLLAAAVDEAEINRQQASLYLRMFPFLRTLRQVTATPPLRAGIRQRHITAPANEPEPQIVFESVLAKRLALEGEEKKGDAHDMLTSLVELQKDIKLQIAATSKKLKNSVSEAEKQTLQEELTKLDRQLSETVTDFERIATGVAAEVFSESHRVTFNWKDELATLLEPSIKELKQLTARARQKSDLREEISDYSKQLATARRAVEHLNRLIDESKDANIKAYLGELLPAWQNMEKRINSKLDLAKGELAKLEDKEISFLDSTSHSIREFFRSRGLYLLVAFLTFVALLLIFRLLARLLWLILPGARKEQRPIHVRVLDLFFKIFSIVAAVFGLVFVLYNAEDWFLLSATIILFIGLAWTVRQTLPKMWQQVRLILNMGSIREGERLIYQGVPWKVEALNVFCKLSNPAFGMHLRIPIENMIGLISRPYHHDEPWFPCKKGDWVAIDGKPFAKVISLSHEQVEVVELGGRRIIYQTGDFLSKSPANLSRNFNLRVVFGLSYSLQAHITTTVLATMKGYIEQKLEEHGYAEDCLSLSVDFLQAGPSSLDVVVLTDFKGEQAPAYRRIERAISKWCVECCTANNWEIPFPQMTVHLPQQTASTGADGKPTC